MSSNKSITINISVGSAWWKSGKWKSFCIRTIYGVCISQYHVSPICVHPYMQKRVLNIYIYNPYSILKLIWRTYLEKKQMKYEEEVIICERQILDKLELLRRRRMSMKGALEKAAKWRRSVSHALPPAKHRNEAAPSPRIMLIMQHLHISIDQFCRAPLRGRKAAAASARSLDGMAITL